MAWITKNSAGTQIDRRDAPYLDETLRKHLETEVLPRFPERRAASLPTLHALQDKHGYLPYQAIEEAAEFLGIPAADLMDTVTFYEEYWLRPHGKYVIWVCQSLACELMGQRPLLERLKDKLGIAVGETTDDGRFTLMHVECLGSCGTAPVALVNEKLHENITAENFERVLDSLA
ncbi:MAG: NADH-quinone oxidoreductase subunit NuoE [Phycisphaeraceae bacterium]